MRTACLAVFSLIITMDSCTQKSSQPGEECLVQFSGISFTRSLNNAAKNTTVEGGKMTIRSDAKKDYFNDPDGKLSNANAPVLLTKVDNTKPFTLTARVTPVFKAMYDAGVLYVFAADKHWQKFCFERDERGRTRVVSVRTIETSDDNNHDILTSEAVYFKLTSDTKTLGMYYSTDNTTWNLARLYKNDFPPEVWLGLSAQSPTGDGTTVTFENCSLTESTIKDFRAGL
jgi:uncharacterized protein